MHAQIQMQQDVYIDISISTKVTDNSIDANAPAFSNKLDYEIKMGFVIESYAVAMLMI